MTRILVDPEQLRWLADQLGQGAGELHALAGRTRGAMAGLEMQARSRIGVEPLLAEANRCCTAVAEQIESMTQYLRKKAQDFTAADTAGADAISAVSAASAAACQSLAATLGAVAIGPQLAAHLRCGSLAHPAPVHTSRPVWVVRASGFLKLAAGAVGVGLGIAAMAGGTATGLGILAIPGGILLTLHSAGTFAQGFQQLVTGEVTENAVEKAYQGLLGDKAGGTAYDVVEWGLTAVGVGGTARAVGQRAIGVVEKVAAHAAEEGVGKLAVDITGDVLDLADKGEVVDKAYDRTHPDKKE